MDKDFKNWGILKERIDQIAEKKFFDKGEIWWCHMGTNIGYEQDGKGKNFTRPVLILKKHTSRVFTAIPLSSKIKDNNPFYISFSFKHELQSAIILQIKLMDSNRLVSRIGYLSKSQFKNIREKTLNLHF